MTEPDKLFKYLFSTNCVVSSCKFIDEETASVSWKHVKGCHSVPSDTNFFIACFTTAYACVKLYNLLDRLEERCLYHNTDSVIFVQRVGDWNPSHGAGTGDLTSKVLSENVQVPAVKGTRGYPCMNLKGIITLNVANCEKINSDSLNDLVLHYSTDLEESTSKKIEVQQPSMVRNKNQ